MSADPSIGNSEALRLRPLIRPLLLVVTFTVLPQVQLRPLWSAFFVGLLLAYRLWLDFTYARMPPRWVLLIGQIVAVTAVWLHFQTFLGGEPGGTLLTLMLGLKIFELKSKRDLFITCILCLLTAMTYLLDEQGLMITAYLLADVVFVVTFLYALEAERWTWSSWRPFLRPGMSLALKALPLVVLIFVLFPRFTTGFGSAVNRTGRTGVTDSLQPGSVARLIPSDEIVFRATFLQGEAPPMSQLYWRGAVLDQVDGLNWTRDKAQEVTEDVANPPMSPEFEIFLEAGSDHLLFALDSTGFLGFPNDPQNHRVLRRDGNVFELREPLQTRERYVLQSVRRGDDPPPSANLTQVKDPPSPEMSTFLKHFAGLTTNRSVRELMEYFREQGYVYSLEPPAVSSVDQFLFKTKEGFCEHYAGAMATILRRLKIPARVVVGFQGGTPSLLGNYVSVRGHDAHAWVEYFDAIDERWHRIDPTSEVSPVRIAGGGEAMLGPDAGLLATWLPAEWSIWRYRGRALFDQVEATWVRFLLGFDLSWQREILGRLGLDGVLFSALPVFLILALLLILAILYFFEAQRREPLSLYEKYYRKLQLILRPHGIWREAHEGPVALLDKIKKQDPDLAAAVEPILAPLILSRFADVALNARISANIQRDLRALKRRKPA